jgi:SMC interacting uncharacterized protein involved in chromosome segregation
MKMMTNSEAIKQLKERYDIGQKEYLNFAPQYIESLKMAMESLEENTKLKADVEQFSNELISVLIENELLKKKNELTNHYFEQYSAAIDEIEKLKKDYSVLARQYNNVENSSVRYYNEVKQLKAELEQTTNLMPKICETCEYEDEMAWEEPCNSCRKGNNWKLKGKVEE